MLVVNEIFRSIQGESTQAGALCTFVRLAACDLRCTWCDTAYAFHEGRPMSVDEVVAAVEGHGCRLVEVTGGEPLLQDEVYPLMDRLIALGYGVLLETGGHRPTVRVPAAVKTILDVKCPGSGQAAHNEWSNLDRLRQGDEVKFVLKDRGDYEFARDVIARHDVASRCAAVLLSPVHGVLQPKALADWMLADRLPARLQLQIHKYVWGANVRGV